MTVRWIRSLEAFREQREPWNELVSHSDMDHAFMTHEWFAAWIHHLGDPRALSIGSVWSDGQLVAIAPMQVTRQRLKRIPVRTLDFLSSGIAPRCGFIAREPADLDPLFAALVRGRDRDVVVLRNLPAAVATSRRFLGLLQAERSALHRLTEPGRRSPYVECRGDYDTYWRSLSKSLRQSVRTGTNRLVKRGHSSTIRRIDDGREFVAVFDRLLEISRRSWKGKMGSDLASRPELQAFYRDISLAGRRLFEAWLLVVDGRIVAFDYYLVGRRSVSLIRTDFDPEFEFFSPGNHLRIALLQDLFARDGTWEYDMGGQCYPYKMRWASRIREHHDVVIAGGTLRGQMVLAAWHAVRSARAILTSGRREGHQPPPADETS